MLRDKGSGRTFLTPLNDDELELQIINTLKADSRVDINEISVSVHRGLVNLSGVVDSAAERRAIIEDVETVVASENIIDEITLSGFVQRTDEELCAAVRSFILRDKSIDAGGVQICAKDGVVTLNGRVNVYSQKSAIENIAWWVPGVIKVINRLHVDDITGPYNEPDY